jgi:hypothetical protein
MLFALLLIIGCGSGGDGDGAGSVVDPDQNSSDDNTTTNPLTALNLELNATSLNLGEKASVVVTGTFKDNTIKEVNNQVEWIITPSGSVDINGATLTTLKDNDTTIKAKIDNVVSNAVDLDIYWEVDGYALPPEPDEIENNATLEGVDSNGNGVRDDVERKIYAKYPKKLHRELLLDGARVFQEIMAQPTEKAIETQKGVSRIIHCEIYLGHLDEEIHSDDWLENGEYIKDLTFNTKERVRKYLDYNIALSGGNFASKPSDWNRGECSKETIQTLEEMGL